MKLRGCLVSDTGRCRTENQDSAGFYSLTEENVFAIVCDGVGGLSHGGLASHYVVTTMTEWFRAEFPQILSEDDWHEVCRQRMRYMIRRINLTMVQYGQNHGSRVGSTMTAFAIHGNEYIGAQIGDSRAYRLNQDRSFQITEDQSLVQMKVRQGLLTQQEALIAKEKNIILQCLGIRTRVLPDFYSGKLDIQERLLLCTDGFIHYTTEDKLTTMFGKETKEEAIQANMRQCMRDNEEHGETDNMTVLLVIQE